MIPGAENRQLVIGIERLALLGKYGEALMQGYLGDVVPVESLSSEALRKLLAAHIVWRPDDSGDVKLNAKVRELITVMIQDENRRQIHADVADTLESIRNKIASYREARKNGNYLYQQQQLNQLRQIVDDFNSHFTEAIASLWLRLNNNFGFVDQLKEKIRENARAEKQIKRLLDGLQLIDFDELIELTGSDGTLRKLLVSQLQQQVSQHYTSLREVQQRTTELMARFRHQQTRSRLISNMAAFLRQHPEFTPSNYALRSNVPVLVNHATPITLAAGVALDRERDCAALATLLQQLPPPERCVKPTAAAKPAIVTPIMVVNPRQLALKEDVERFYVAVVDAGARQKLSALAYLQTKQLGWDAEIWLFQVIAEYQGLPREEQRYFRLHYHENKVELFNDVLLVYDISVELLSP